MQNSGKTPPSYRLNLQHVLIGAALGLYYGITYKGSVLEPSYVYVLIWSMVAGLFTVIIKSIRTKPSFKVMLIDFLKMSLMFAIFLVGLEFRKQVDIWGGKTAVIAYTTALGGFVGFLLGLQNKADTIQSNQKKKGG